MNGEWTFNFGYFGVKSDGSYEAAPEAGSYQGKITITQNSSQLNISAPGAVPMTNGTVSGNQFESKGPSPMRWVGTISGQRMTSMVKMEGGVFWIHHLIGRYWLTRPTPLKDPYLLFFRSCR